MDWFRMYGEFASDAKVQSMSEAMQRRLVMLFCLRCSNSLETLQDDEIAFALRIDDAALAETKALFLRKRFIDEAWNIVRWDTRQYASDSSAARVARHRANKKATVKQACNVTVSVQNRADTEQNRTEAEQKEQHSAARSTNAVDLSVAMRKAGVATQPADPRLIALAAQGVEPETATAACEEAKRAKPNERIGSGYVFAILERWAADAAALRVAGARPPPSRASPGFQNAAAQSRTIADRLTRRTANARPDDNIIDLNAPPASASA
jgi:hypothetical protein